MEKKQSFQENTRPNIVKRLISGGFDLVLLCVLFWLGSLIVFSSGLANKYNSYIEEKKSLEDQFMVESGYGEQIENADGTTSVVIKGNATEEQKASYEQKLKNSNFYNDAKLNATVHKYALSVLVLGILEVILFLVVPFINKRRATLGMLMCGITCFSLSKQIAATPLQIINRFLIVAIFETAFLFMWLEVYSAIIVAVFGIVIILTNKNYRSLRDILTGTVLIENLSFNPINNK